MTKKRFGKPYDFIWKDEDGMLHICNFLTCNDGCVCEKAEMSFEFLARFIDKYKKRFFENE